MKPLAVDLCAGLGGWSEGLLAEGWDVVGFDVERHQYGHARYPAQLVLQDILTIDGKNFRGHVSLIVASPPCQKYSYMAMPWRRSKELARWYRDPQHPQRLAELNALFDACLRIAREAECPIVIENVRGAQPWVGRARATFGSFYLWGDVPALMPMTRKAIKGHGGAWFKDAEAADGTYGAGNFRIGVDGRKVPSEREHASSIKNGGDWFSSGADCSLQRRAGSKSSARKAASAHIAKIPFVLSSWIARVYYPIHESHSDSQGPEIQSVGDCS